MSLTQDEVIALAREAGFQAVVLSPGVACGEVIAYWKEEDDLFKVIARLAQACYDAGARAENEACEQVCYGHHDRARTSPGAARALACAEDIRKRRK